MANEHYRHLVDELCLLTQIPSAAVLYESLQLIVRGIDFSLRPIENPEADAVLLHADFGPLPSRQREAILLRLLDTNFHLVDGVRHSSFSHNEHTGHVLFGSALPLESTTAAQVLLLMGHIAEYAQAWRQSYFLDDQRTRARAF
ncbi:MAG: CesT family type III secretion system chaperone [Pseudomonas sp.]|uniref:CesT family type III secretion system chaperone n=1 Tax=Pseudomonas sp. TaxID=306 RepID=UPI003C70A2BB